MKAEMRSDPGMTENVGRSLKALAGVNSASATSIAAGPLMRTIDRSAAPAADETATMVSGVVPSTSQRLLFFPDDLTGTPTSGMASR